MNPSAGTILPTGGRRLWPALRHRLVSRNSRKTVLRGGYALMYNQMPLNIPLLMWQSCPISPQIATITPAGGNLSSFRRREPSTARLPATNPIPIRP